METGRPSRNRPSRPCRRAERDAYNQVPPSVQNCRWTYPRYANWSLAGRRIGVGATNRLRTRTSGTRTGGTIMWSVNRRPISCADPRRTWVTGGRRSRDAVSARVVVRDHDRVRVGVQRGDEDVACSETGGVVRAAGDLGLAGHAVSRIEEDDQTHLVISLPMARAQPPPHGRRSRRSRKLARVHRRCRARAEPIAW